MDNDKFVKIRTCRDDGWQPSETPNCTYSQKSFSESIKCPLGYTEVLWNKKMVCVLLTDPQPWNNTCLSAGTEKTILDLSGDERDAVYNYLQERGVEQVWMPAKRVWSYGPVLWTLAGGSFGESVEFDDIAIELTDDVYEHGCFNLNTTANGESGSIEDCQRAYPILCVYNEDSALIKLACPKDFYTTRFEGHQSRCYSAHKIQGPNSLSRQSEYSWVSSECRGRLYTMNSVEKTVIYEKLARNSDLSSSDRCLFGVMPNVYIESQQQWKTLVPFLDYVNWAYPMQTSGNIVTTDRDGQWHWTNDVFTCIACEQKVEILMPQIILKFHDGHLYVIIYNNEFLWREQADEPGIKCFTDSDHELVRSVKVEDQVWSGLLTFDEDNYVSSVRDQTRTVFELKTYGDGPGYYWCDGHAMPDFKLIKSEPVVAYKNLEGQVFAVMIETHCLQCRQYFQNKYTKEISKKFKDFLNKLRKRFRRQMIDEISVENVRVMKIESIDLAKNVSRLLFHVTISMENDLDDSEEDNLEMSFEMLEIYKIRNYLHRMLESTREDPSTEYKYLSLNNTEYCLPDSISVVTDLSWLNAKIGETSAPKELCLLGNGLPVLRQCVGDFIYGGVWRNVTRTQQCSEQMLSPITKSLYDIDRQYTDAADTSNVLQTVSTLLATTNQSSLIPADLFYLGKVMYTITRFSNSSVDAHLYRNESENLFTIYNSLMMVNESTTKLSAALNSTNTLLDAFDNIINRLSSENLLSRTGINLTENANDGTIAIITGKLLVYVIDPMVNNVSGIALFCRPNASEHLTEDFRNYDVRLLYTNQSATQLLEEEYLEIASFVPLNLLNRLHETRNLVAVTNTTASPESPPPPPVSIVITIYYNDLLFQEFKQVTYAKPGGKIISVTIPGYGPILPVLLPIFIRTNAFTAENITGSDVCGYWNFNSNEWSRDGCEYGGSSGYYEPTVLCACSHLTHFAYLVLGTYFHSISSDDDVIITDTHQEALDLITLLGCSFSLVGICGILVTAIIFPTWREKPGSKVLLHLSAAIALQMILICFVNTEVRSLSFFLNQQWYSCVSMGALLHYSVLVAFTWMLITAYLQFIRYVRVIGHTRSNRFFLKAFLFGWGIPLIPVLLVVGIDPNSYIPNLEQLGQGICYPTGYALYVGVIVPMGIIVLANLVIFILVIYNILRGPDGKLRTNERDLSLAQFRLTILLFFLLGLTWIFGFCASTQVGLVFSYLFCLTATMQGFVLFLYFIILDPITRNLWGQFLRRYLNCSPSNNFK